MSDFLIEKNKKIYQILTTKRIERMKQRKQMFWNGYNVGTMTIKRLKEFGKEQNQIKKKDLRILILKTLKARDQETDEEKDEEKDEDNNQNDNSNQQQIASSLSYLENYPKEKSWYDLDFTLWNNKLSRLGVICSGRSGAQLPSCCAHGSSCIWLIFYSLFGNINTALATSNRDKKIKKNVCSLLQYREYIKKTETSICNDDKQDVAVQSDACDVWYHPKCINTTQEDIEKDKHTWNIWHCPMCCSAKAFIVRHI